MMNYDQSLKMVGSANFVYAKVAGLYVSSVTWGNLGELILKPDYESATNLTETEIEWLYENVSGVQFFKIEVQAQSVPVKAEELWN
ncbi:hypothetical protein 278BB001_273 [Bacillus phage 278BB001]|nr:hypothetical protein 278BB001_11 [Bacillus phage 278BB001]QZA70417.1 hypothetical protein 278BB001_273 [Bacillus phage 278BB001]